MVAATLNAVFCFGAGALGIFCWRKGWPFTRHGCRVIQTQTAHPDFRQNVERRRAISEGGQFLLAAVWRWRQSTSVGWPSA